MDQQASAPLAMMIPGGAFRAAPLQQQHGESRASDPNDKSSQNSSPSSCLSSALLMNNGILNPCHGSSSNKRPATAALPPVTVHSSLFSAAASSALPEALTKRPRLDDEYPVYAQSGAPSYSFLPAAGVRPWGDALPGVPVRVFGSREMRGSSIDAAKCAEPGASPSCGSGGARARISAEGAPENSDEYDVSFHDDANNSDNDADLAPPPEHDSCDSPQPSAPRTPSSPVHTRSRLLSLSSSSQWLFQSHECSTTVGAPQHRSLLDDRATHHPIRLFLHSPASSAASGSSSHSSSASAAASPSTPNDRRMWLRNHPRSTYSSSQSLLSTRTNASSDARAEDSDNDDDGDDDPCDVSSGDEDNDEGRENWGSSSQGRPASSAKTASRSSWRSDRYSSSNNNANSGTMAATASSSSPSMFNSAAEENNEEAAADDMDGVVATIDTLTESVQSWSLVQVRSGGPRSSETASGYDDDNDAGRSHAGGQARRRHALSAKKRVMRALRSSSSSSSLSLASLSSSANPPPRARNAHPFHAGGPLSLPPGAGSPTSSSPSSAATSSESHRSISSFFSVASSTRMLEG
jgi:hypothetical protein